MCWTTKSRINAIKRIAYKDIPVHKIVLKKSDNSFLSAYEHFPYEIGEEYKLEEPLVLYPCSIFGIKSFRATGGFHSYGKDVNIEKNPYSNGIVTKYGKIILDFLSNKNEDGEHIVIDCIIPKDSSYYVNEKGEYVSDAIRITGISNDYQIIEV